jgi:hypothetical protein
MLSIGQILYVAIHQTDRKKLRSNNNKAKASRSHFQLQTSNIMIS